MRIADFIVNNTAAILVECDSVAAAQLPAAAGMESRALRDHAEEILQAIAKDVATYSSRKAHDTSPSEKPGLAGAPETAAQIHAILRAGFTIGDVATAARG